MNIILGKPMNNWVSRSIVGSAITVILGGAGIWVNNVNASRNDVIELKTLLPEIQNDVREIKQDVKDLQRRR